MHNSTTFANATAWLDIQWETGVLFSTISMATSILMIYLLYFYYQDNNNNLGTTTNIAILFFAGLTTSVADFLVHQPSLFLIYEIHTFVKLLVFGSVMFYVGMKYLFVTPPPDSEIETFGEHHKSVSLVVLIITIPLVLLEIVATIIKLLDEPDVFYAMVNLIAIIQKIIQGCSYHFVLCKKIPILEKKTAASFFFKILALLNFSMWIQSILEAEQELDKPVIEGVLKNTFTVLAATYFALTIDYRLLCSLLFLEHSYEISHNKLRKNTTFQYQHSNDTETSYVKLPDSRERFYEKTKMASRFGYAAGCALLFLQFLNALEYLPMVGPAVNVFGILAEIAVVVQGCILIRQVRPVSKANRKWRESNSKGVDLMVSMMGVTGFSFWIFKTFLLIVWCVRMPNVIKGDNFLPEMQWMTVKFFIRALFCVFQIYLYIRADLHMGCQNSIMYSRLNHFLIPSLTMSFLAVFVNSVIDSYHGDIKHLFHQSGMNIVVVAFYEAGIPIHLGFVLHLFIHYLLINNKMKAALEANERRFQIDNILNRHSNQDRYENDVHNNDDDKMEPLLSENKTFRTC